MLERGGGIDERMREEKLVMLKGLSQFISQDKVCVILYNIYIMNVPDKRASSTNFEHIELPLKREKV